MARTSGFRRLTALCVPALVVLLVPLAAGAQQTAPAPSGPTAPAPGGAPGPAPPTAPAPTPVPVPAPTPVSPGPPGLAPGGPPASPVVPLPERAGPAPTPSGPVGAFRFAPPLEAAGPLRAQLFGTVEEEFTDNANQAKHNKDSEFRTRLAPGVVARIDRLNTTGLLLYAPQIFIRDFEDTTVNHALTLRGGWRPMPFIQVSAGDDFTRSTDFRDLEDPGTRRIGTNSFIENQASAEAAWTPPNARAGLSYTHKLALNEDPALDDSQTHTVRPSLLWETPRWSASGGYALSRGEMSVSSSYWEHTADGRYTRRLNPALSGVATGLLTLHDADQEAATDFVIGRARAGATWALGPDRILEVLGGADVFNPDPGSSKIRPSGLASYTQRFPWFALAAGYQAGFEARFQEVDNTGVSFSQRASVLLSTTAFRNLTGTLELRWIYNDFQTTTPTVTTGVREHTWDVELGVRYQILRGLFASAGYVFTLRDSTDPNAEFTENRVRLSVTYPYDLL